MYHVGTPRQLYALCRRLRRDGAVGCLISGGFDAHGRLPIEAYLGAIRDVKRNLELIISAHVGFADKGYAGKLAEAGIDIADVNLVADRETLIDIMNLKKRPQDAERTLRSLYDCGPPFIAPHILVGAYYGKIKGEMLALSAIDEYNPYVLIVTSLVPTERTPMESVPPPSVNDVISVLEEARRGLPKTELALGCMRPRGRYSERLERTSLERGLIDRIVLPSTLRHVQRIEACCSLPVELENVVG